MSNLYGLLLAIGLAASSLSACGGMSATAASTPASAQSEAQAAWAACTHEIETQKGPPASGAPKFSPASVTKLDAREYVAVLYYAKDGRYYRCGIKEGSDGTWSLDSLASLQPSELSVWGLKK
jgi:hypothetical protein